MKINEGFIDVDGGKVWYEIVGEKTAIPLIVFHGGPGYPHDYLEPLEDLANEREVVFYDQLGCGNSQRTKDKSFWTVEYFVRELSEIVKKLYLKQYHILGHSWGAGLAVAFAITKPNGLKSLILSDPYISTPQWNKDARRLIKRLPKNIQEALEKDETKSKEYKEASDEYYYQFVFRLKQYPVAVIKSNNKMSWEIYNYMWGAKEFKITASLKNFDLSEKLSEIKVPSLFLCGRFDEATPESTEYFKSLIPNAKM
ncbi:MAG: proline iminopeptidase-family hydrolase, partial [Candidatus Levybacteria bacterium]|nr:proline iminopeptidase-family hydrolase [Candidatus Levybacteria bacterium]